jgi:hypothetical protein
VQLTRRCRQRNRAAGTVFLLNTALTLRRQDGKE